MVKQEPSVHGGTDAYRKDRHDEGRHSGLHLDERDIPDDHVDDLPVASHVAEVRLGRETRRQAHVQVALKAEQRRHQDEQFRYMGKDLPVLEEMFEG